ncbi:MAG: hypothetical protein IK125_08665, partial [Lachnospiraceae bacterium]|nr:hypothetical protein [Lachnospiraceae bacterium]
QRRIAGTESMSAVFLIAPATARRENALGDSQKPISENRFLTLILLFLRGVFLQLDQYPPCNRKHQRARPGAFSFVLSPGTAT